jgi:transposase
MLVRTLVAAHHQMLKVTVQMSNQIRGVIKTFGLVVPKSAGSALEGHIRTLLATNAELEQIICRCSTRGWPCVRVSRS